MQIISVIKLKDNCVEFISSFNGDGHEETAKAEKLFKDSVAHLNPQIPVGDLDSYVEDGHYEVGDHAINLCWSNIK